MIEAYTFRMWCKNKSIEEFVVFNDAKFIPHSHESASEEIEIEWNVYMTIIGSDLTEEFNFRLNLRVHSKRFNFQAHHIVF